MSSVPKVDSGATRPDTGNYSSTWGVPPAYQVVLHVTDSGGASMLDSSGGSIFPLVGNLPEKFDVSIAAHWDSPLSKSSDESISKLGIGKAGSAISDLGKMMCMRVNTKVMSAQVWQSTDPLSFTFQFKLLTKTNAKVDVQDRVKGLMMLVMPSEEGAFLKAPGPTIAGALGSWASGSDTSSLSGRKVTLYIGTFMVMTNCVVNNVQVEFDSKLDANGIPISATANVTVSSFYACTTLNDFNAMFKN